MKANQLTEEQIIKLLEEAEASSESIKDFVRRKGISEWTFYRRRKKYSGMRALPINSKWVQYNGVTSVSQRNSLYKGPNLWAKPNREALPNN